MNTLAVRNQNPGNLRDSTGGFQSFSDPVEGKAALYNDLTAKMTGHSKTGLNGQSSLLDFSKTYAPAGDNNDPVQYAANLANKLGVSPDTPIGQLMPRIDDFASAVASNEDSSATYKKHPPLEMQLDQATQTSPQRQTFTQSIQGAQPQNQENPIISTIKGIGNALTFGGAGEFGDELGTSLAIEKEKLKGLFGGQDNSRFIDQPDYGRGTTGLAKTVAGLGLLTLGGEGATATQSSIKGADVLSSPAVENGIKRVGLKSLENFNTLSAGEKLEALTEATKMAPEAEKLTLKQAIEKIAPQAIKEAGGKVPFAQAHPVVSKLLGLGKLALAGTMIGGAINKAEKISGLIK